MTVAHELPLSALRRFGRTVVAVPHPDDESLGCGGLIALLCQQQQPVHAVLVSDGSQSHPGSRQYDAGARRALRAAEWQQALGSLGVAPQQLHHLAWPDGEVPGPGDPRFPAAVRAIEELLTTLAPATLVLPWRRDPHPDHRATHALFTRAAGTRPHRCLEYAVWLPDRGAAGDLPEPDEVRSWRLDIASVLPAKRRAIASHRSQLGHVITDDPGGFTLPPSLLRHADRPVELYFEGPVQNRPDPRSARPAPVARTASHDTTARP